MKILVTGGAGFIGSNVALELESQGHEVTIIDNFFTGKRENIEGFKGKVIEAKAEKFRLDWENSLCQTCVNCAQCDRCGLRVIKECDLFKESV